MAPSDTSEKIVTASEAESGILCISSGRIESRRDGIGVPSDILYHKRPLDDRQQILLNKLPEYGSRVTVDKCEVSMIDLSALTAKEGVEFAMFTRGAERLVVRGDEWRVNVNALDAAVLNRQGYKWSGHTHVGTNLIPSIGDRVILRQFWQLSGVVYNALGEHYVYGRD